MQYYHLKNIFRKRLNTMLDYSYYMRQLNKSSRKMITACFVISYLLPIKNDGSFTTLIRL